MGAFDVRGGELKKLIKLAKKQPVTFAYNPGSGPKDDYFGMDRRKPAKVVGKAAKDEGVGTKAAFGTATVEGKVLSLTCIKTVPSIAKKLKKYLLSEKVRLNVQVLDESGKVLEAEIEEDLPDDPDLAEEGASQQTGTPQPEAKQPEQKEEPQKDTSGLRDQLKALGGRIQELETDTAKLFGKHYKQLLELFKAEQFDRLEAGLAKVGQALDKLSSAPPGPEESEDPNKPKWEALQPKIQVIYDKAVAAAPTAAEKLQAAWAQVIALAKGGEYGKAIAAAKKLVPALQKLAQPAPQPEAKQQTEARPEATDTQSEGDETGTGKEPTDQGSGNFEKAKETLTRRLSAMEKALDVARRVLPEQSSAIDKLTAVITGLEDEKGLAAARKAANDLQGIADAGAERAAQIAAALEEVERVRGYIEHMGQEFETSLGDTPPARLSQPLDTAKDGLSGKDEIDPVKIGQTVEEAMRQLEQSERDIAQLLADKAAWEAQLELFEPRVKALENHNKKDEEPVKARIKTITDGLAAAKVLAGEHKYKEALAALPPLAKTCAEAEKYADACSQYSALFADRKKRVDDLLSDYPLGDASVHDLIKGTLRKIKEDFDAAEAKGTANPPEYGVAMKTLEPMADRAQQARWRAERAASYTKKMNDVKGYLTDREKHPDASEVKLYLGQMRKLIADADISKTKSFLKSLSMLERADNLDNTLYDAMKRSKDFKAAYKTAEQNIKDLKAHDGHEGITKHISGLETDLASAKVKGEEAKFLHGQKICEAITAEFAKLQALAQDYKAYLDAKKLLKTAKDAWDAKYIGKVSGLTDQVTALEGKATDAVAKEDYKLAKKHIDEAKKVADTAKSEADIFARNAGYVDNVKSTIESGSGDFSGVITSIESFKTSLDGLDKDNIFTTELTNAVKPVQTAQGKIGKSPQDDAGIKADLESARSQLAALLDKLVQYSVYKRARDAHKSAYTSATAKDRGEALKTETEAIDKVFEDAKQKAETTKDPAAAVTEIAKLTALLRDLERKAADYDAYDALLKGAIKQHNDWFDAANGTYGKPKDVLDKEFAKYGEQKTAAETDANSKKWKDALAKLQKAKESVDLYRKMFADYIKAVDEKKDEITDRLSPVDTDPLVKDDYDAMKPKLDKIDALIADRQYDQAIALINTAAWDIYRAQDKITRHAELKPKRDTAGEAVQKLFEVRCPPVEADYVRAKRLLDQVDEEVAANTYPNAMKIVDQIAPMCVEPTRIGKEHKEYKPVREAADKAVADLRKDYPKDDTVALQLERLDIRLAKLTGEEAKRKFAELKAVAQAIADDAAKVAAAAKSQAALNGMAKELKEAGPTETKGFDKQLEAVRGELQKLQTHDGKDCQQVKDHMARIQRLLDEADHEFNETAEVPSARDKLAQAASSVARAFLLAEQYVQLDAEVKALEKRHGEEKAKHTEPAALKGLFDASARNILGAKGAVGKGEFNTAMQFVKAAEELLDKAVGIGTHHAAYKTKLGEVKPRVDALVSHTAHYSVAEEVDEARLYLSAAEEMAAALKPKEALDNLKKCEKICTIAEVKADMHSNEEPDEAKIKKLLETKEGMKELDEMFETLDPSVKRKACKKVLEMRFGMELKQTTDKAGNIPDTDLEAMAPNVTRLFSLMADLDEGHTSQNPSMALVQRFGTEKGTSSFGKSYSFANKRMTKNVKLRIGRAEMPEETVIGQEWQLGEVDENCKPVDDTPAQSFNWTTLHEIGHAVDDKYGVMKRNGSSKKYGGWKEYGGDVSEIADKAAKHFKYDKSYIASYLSKPGGNYAKPDPAGGAEADEWDQRRLEAEAWCDSIRSDKTIWYSATETKRLQIGGRVYQEAYSGKWVSYEFAARSQGVRGYQFRAPGEWFADIYAAFHSGKMNPKHPAREWLEKDMSN
ncbi:hypothetical protein [Leisingera sp. JC11]|uniref:hypothetical protein n=1 Tax=Leisingera sp. JC11 TaxID=3042469 RepID=UPI003456F2FE